MKQKKLVPKRRFEGFTNEWKNKTLDNLGSFGRTYAFSRAKEGFGNYYHVHYGDIHVNYNGFINEETKVPSLNVEGTFEILKKNDVIIADASEDYLDLGKTVVIEEAGDRDIIAGLHTFKYTPNKHLNSKFYLYYSQTNLFKKFSYEKGTGISVFGISKENMSKMQFNIPLVEEQQKIGQFFKHLDEMITLEQRKIDKTKALKSAYLAEMFPAEGECIPKRRFEGFTEEWQEQKLSSLSDVRDGTHDSPKYYSEGHPFITSKNVKGGMINYDEVQYISDTDFQKINKRSKVDKNDILMGMIGTIGNIALITETPNFAIKNVALIKDTGSVSYLYLYHYLESPNIKKQLLDDMDGGTQKFISLNRIRNLLIKTPEVEEQKKIGNFFQHLDSIIKTHQQKLDKLKATKQAYLHEMFV